LRQELSDHIVDGPRERYQLDWPGKREALLAANAPIAKTLRPCREESVDFDTTRNLFIEGDNLDALKLLQETYLNQVKLIYIDPPYNTGRDFIYDDDFSQRKDDYLARSNQEDTEGNRLVANTEANGRFHSDWLSMRYARIKLARNLLSEDGVIFISIDSGEAPVLWSVCNEIFGEKNFVSTAVWQKAYVANMTAKHISTTHDFILIFSRNAEVLRLGRFERTDEQLAAFRNLDNDPRGPWKAENLSAGKFYAAGQFEIETPAGEIVRPPPGRYWRCNEPTYKQWLSEGRIWFGKDGRRRPMLKKYRCDVQEGLTPDTWWAHQRFGTNKSASTELKKLFNGKQIFDTPTPVELINQILSLALADNHVVLDFFAGSGTLAHAVMQHNAAHGSKTRYILVQLGERLAEGISSEVPGLSTIADASKERVRRAGDKVKSDNAEKGGIEDLDIGFRVLKIDSSNMKDVYYTPDEVTQAGLFDQVDNIKPDRTAEDLLFQVLLDWGVDLSLPIRAETLAGRQVFFVDTDALAACFETGVDEPLVRAIAERRPLRAVFRDAGFSDDSMKINVEQIFKTLSPGTEVKAI
jgi:adenine-specific DNA-methyltransferase